MNKSLSRVRKAFTYDRCRRTRIAQEPTSVNSCRNKDISSLPSSRPEERARTLINVTSIWGREMNALTQIEGGTPVSSSMVIGRFVADSRWHGDLSEIDIERVLGYSIIRHRNIKSYKQLDGAEAHNSRDMETPNARADAPEPVEMLTWREGSFRERAEWVRGYYNAPEHPQKHGNLAWEDVLTASPEYWNRSGDWKLKSVEEIMADPLTQLAFKYAQWKHFQRLISVKVHLDEETPHIHVIALALVHGLHKIRGRKPNSCPLDAEGNKIDLREPEWKYTYYGSKVRGSGWQLARNHDEWNNFVKDLGLLRGSDGTKMPEGERRERNKGYTGRASTIIADAKKQGEAEVAAAKDKAGTILADAQSQANRRVDEAQTKADELLKVAQETNDLLERKLEFATKQAEETVARANAEADAIKREAVANALDEGEKLKAKVERDAHLAAEDLMKGASDNATELLLNAVDKAKLLVDEANQEANRITCSAAAAAAAQKSTSECEGRDIVEAARAEANRILETARKEAKAAAEAEAKAIRDAAELDAARIRSAAEADQQRHSEWFDAESARHLREKNEAVQAKASAEAANTALSARQEELKRGQDELQASRGQIESREGLCRGKEESLADALKELDKHRGALNNDLLTARKIAREMQAHHREFRHLLENTDAPIPPETTKAGEVMKSSETAELIEALKQQEAYEAWRDAQLGR